MAVIALVAGRYVIQGLSGRLNAVVASGATSRNGRMIHVCDSAPVGSNVAIGALAGR